MMSGRTHWLNEPALAWLRSAGWGRQKARSRQAAPAAKAQATPVENSNGVADPQWLPHRRTTSTASVATPKSADGLLDDLFSYDLQLLMLVLAQSAQPGHRLVLRATRPAH